MKNLHKNKSKLLGFAILLVFSLLLTSSKVLAFSGDGVGTSDDPYRITDCSEWLEMADDLDGSYIVDGNIDCTGATYTPIGTDSSPFTGTLDGDGWEISGVSIVSGSHLGLFGYTNGATIKNLDFASSTISGGFLEGGIAANAIDGTISNVHVSAVNITSTGGSVGGLVGIGHGTLLIEKSSYNGTISVDSSYVGGLIGRLEGNIIINDSYAAGSIGSGGDSYVGGFGGAVLSGSPVISRSYSAMEFTDIGTYNGGFIGGFFGGTVIDSFSASDMTVGAGSFSGAMFGVGDGTSTNNYFDQYLASRSDCTGNGAAACTGVNAANATPNYFKNNSTNDPLGDWGFTDIWSASSGSYPQLSQMPQSIYVCEFPTSKKTTVHLLCDIQSVGDIGTITWDGRYRIKGASSWIPVVVPNDLTGVLDVSGLTPNTTYEVGLKYTSSLYGGSYWVTAEITTDVVPSSGGQGGGSQDEEDENASGEGYGPVNEDISEDIPVGSSAKNDKNPVTNPLKTPANIFNPKTAQTADSHLKLILIATGVVLFLILLIKSIKTPASTYTK